MNRANQSAIIKEAINSCLEKGLTNKHAIYTKVVDDLGVPRPTVRRVARDLRHEMLVRIDELGMQRSTARKVARDLRNELLSKIEILQAESQKQAAMIG